MSSQYTNTYALGSTNMVVGLSSIAQFVPPNYCNGVFFKKLSGGTLALASGLSQVFGASMYIMGETEIVNLTGPARFFLAAAGATTVVGVGLSFSDGVSLQPR